MWSRDWTHTSPCRWQLVLRWSVHQVTSLSGPTCKKLLLRFEGRRFEDVTTALLRFPSPTANPGENAPTALLTQPADLMALNSSRSAWSLSRQSLRPLRASTLTRPACRGAADLARQPTALREQDDPLNKPLSEADIEQAKPRWAYTPPALKAPYGFQLKEAKDPANSIWHVNEDPAKLDDFYERFLGHHGSRMLPEELRWLAVTHKSFDYGRRGFNTKLAFFGTHHHGGPRLDLRWWHG